ncbi:MAG: hypothetical protein K2X87_13860 [Gemmataceae bacterium]|nr:hypothetical protein [Gemmataceae bacterium]
MTGKRWLAAAGLAGLLAQAGCVTCCHTASKAGFEAGPDCEVPLPDRQKVYAVLVSGVSPGMDALRDRLAARGFTKIYSAPVTHLGWLEREMARVCAEEPGARFVVVGGDLGCLAAKDLAARGQAAGVPVDAVIFLGPVGIKSAAAAKTVVVLPGGVAETLPGAETLFVPSAGQFDLPDHPRAFDAVYRQLAASAARVEHPPTLAAAEPDYPHAPPIRFLPGVGVPDDLGAVAGPLPPVDNPTRVGPYGAPWPGQKLPMPRKADTPR